MEMLARIRALGITVLLVEHDMKMVMGVSDRVVCLNQGRIIANGTPARDPARPRGDPRLSRREVRPCSRLRASSAATARSRPCASCRSRCSEGELVTLIGANGAGKTTTLKAISGVLRAGRRPHHVPGRGHHARVARGASSQLGIAHCPEGRRVFPYMTVRENLEMGCYLRARRGRDRGRHGAAVRALSRSSPSGATRRPARCRAASSRCWRSRAR